MDDVLYAAIVAVCAFATGYRFGRVRKHKYVGGPLSRSTTIREVIKAGRVSHQQPEQARRYTAIPIRKQRAKAQWKRERNRR